MDSWKSAGRTQERKLWNTLFCVGVVLTVTLGSSILLVAGSAGSAASAWFYVQQWVLLALSAGGTVLAFRRWRSLRA
ncbi:hypothetical protein ACX80H_13875 [Arthrobacter sp. MDT2-2]|jgi:hypothetical protein